MTKSGIVLITRVRTNNKGNQALSAGWVSLLQKAFPQESLRVFERRPAHLQQFTLDEFRRARNSFRAFDAVTTKLARLMDGRGGASAAPPIRIELDEAITPKPRFHELRQHLQLRRWAARAGVYKEAYRRRLGACASARLVVINPAGEFFPHDPAPALYHLLDAHVSHKLGVPTAMVNHTMDITDPTLRQLIPQIYRHLSLIGFRDEKSVSAFQAMGGDLRNVVVAPDLALTTTIDRPSARLSGTIALAIHTPDAEVINRLPEWLQVISALRGKGFKVVLVSNEMPSDKPFFEKVQQRISIPIEGEGLPFDRYAQMLGTFDFVVTSRMHTGILAMVAGTPVIPVEGPSFKISGLFQELGLAMPVIQPTSAGWIDRIVDEAIKLREGRDAASSEVAAKIAATRGRIFETLTPRLQAVVEQGGHR